MTANLSPIADRSRTAFVKLAYRAGAQPRRPEHGVGVLATSEVGPKANKPAPVYPYSSAAIVCDLTSDPEVADGLRLLVSRSTVAACGRAPGGTRIPSQAVLRGGRAPVTTDCPETHHGRSARPIRILWVRLVITDGAACRIEAGDRPWIESGASGSHQARQPGNDPGEDHAEDEAQHHQPNERQSQICRYPSS